MINTLQKYSSIVLIIFSFVFIQCGPSTRTYQPEKWESQLLQESSKTFMPTDVVKDPESYKGKLIHWVGVIDTFYTYEKNNQTVVDLVLDQKYYDYIEDFNIQQETMFLSPLGNGRFILRKTISNSEYDSLKNYFNYLVKDKSLGFCYGKLAEIKESLPVLEASGLRIIPEAFYATNIFSYEVARDSLGNVINMPDGFPALTNFKLLKVAGPGKND